MNRMIHVTTDIPEGLRDAVLILAHQSDLAFAEALAHVLEAGLDALHRNLRNAVAAPNLATHLPHSSSTA